MAASRSDAVALAAALRDQKTLDSTLLKLVTGTTASAPQQGGSGVYLIHLAARHTHSATVMRAVLDACPDLLEAKTDLVCGPVALPACNSSSSSS
jgi:hypothetical protein